MRTIVVRLVDGSTIRLKGERITGGGNEPVVYVNANKDPVGIFPFDSVMGCWFEDAQEGTPEFAKPE